MITEGSLESDFLQTLVGTSLVNSIEMMATRCAVCTFCSWLHRFVEYAN